MAITAVRQLTNHFCDISEKEGDKQINVAKNN